ncbi:MAG: hypothetical protein IJC45_10660 [Clostridia bacterium]|nr:hypothetical protein [Clostridia bacterium]
MEYVYFVFLLAAAVCTYIFMYKNGSLKMKMITASMFLGAGLVLLLTGGRYTSPYCCVLFAGLCAAFTGDYTLRFDAFGMKGLPGIVCFAIAHILYICAFALHTPPTLKTLWLLIPWAIIVTFFTWLGKARLKINFGGTGPAVLIYAMIITVMVLFGIRTGIYAFLQGDALQKVKGMVLAFSVIVFMASDCGVCMQMFGNTQTFRIGKKEYSYNSFSSVTYFGAQMLIASAITL